LVFLRSPLLAIVGGGGAFMSFWLASYVSGRSVCPFLILTGYPCPGCGGSRAVFYLFHGNVENAFFANAYVFFLLPYLLILFSWWVRSEYRGDGFPNFPQWTWLVLAGSAFLWFVFRLTSLGSAFVPA